MEPRQYDYFIHQNLLRSYYVICYHVQKIRAASFFNKKYQVLKRRFLRDALIVSQKIPGLRCQMDILKTIST